MLSLVAPLVVLCAGIAGTVEVRSVEQHRRAHELATRLDLVGTGVGNEVHAEVERQLKTVAVAASTALLSSRLTAADLDELGTSLLSTDPHLVAIGFAWDDGTTKVVYTGGVGPVVGAADVAATAARAQQMSTVSFVPMPGPQGRAPGYYAAVAPIVHPGGGNLGGIALVVAMQGVLSSADAPAGIGVTLRNDAGQPVGERAAEQPVAPRVTETFEIDGKRWSLDVFAGQQYLDAILDRRRLILVVGLGSTAIVTLLVSALVRGNKRWEAAAENATRSLRESEARLRATIAAAPDLLLVVGPDGTVRSASDRSVELLQMPPWALVGRRIQEIVPGWGTALAGDRETTWHDDRVLTAHRGDGTLALVGVATSALRPGDESSPLVVVLRDLSPQELARADRALLSSIVTTARDPILALDAEGRITSWNPGAERFYGWSAEEMIGQSIEVLIPDEELELARTDLAYVGEGAVVERVMRHRRKDGSHAALAVTISPLTGVRGSRVTASLIAHDLTEEMRARQDLATYAADLERSNRDLEEWASIVSHDLSEPLRVVGGYTGLLAHRYRLGAVLDQRAVGYLDEVASGVERMRQLIEGILEYSRLRSDPREWGPVDLNEVAQTAIANLGAATAEGGASIEVGELPTVMGTRPQLVQLMQNLVANAIRFRDPNRPAFIRIGAREDPSTGRWAISVSDNGIGIPRQHTEQIFTMFRRLHPAHNYEGMGVGLAVCRRVVDLHGGDLRVESTVGAGSTFTFTLAGVRNETSAAVNQEAIR